MPIYTGQGKAPLLLLHGGAGGQDPKGTATVAAATVALRQIANAAVKQLAAGADATDVLIECLKGMELDPQFNAGLGAALQADGTARLTAAMMHGTTQTFSGVIGATDIVHPSLLARSLQFAESRVLAPPGVETLARRLQLPVESPVTARRREQWLDKAKGQSSDTVGCVILTASGRLLVGTSTGGRGFETPGRVSDSATVAGTYASAFAAIGATGVGEQIVDDAVAARLETRCRDGMKLAEAAQKTYQEALDRGRAYGWIAANAQGEWSVVHTTPAMSFIVTSGDSGELASS